MELVADIKKGYERAIARAITLVENNSVQGFDLLKKLYSQTKLSYLVGITGPPGSGKSTLTGAIVKHWLKQNLKVGIIAIDPTSSFSGGALLGDRIRMRDIAMEKNVFIRSMATRGSMGGLNSSIYDTVVLMSAAGFDYIIIETVGVGQNEIDIVNLADTVLVVTTPEVGDEIQTFKAGIMETGDIFIVNKADRPGVNKMELMLKQMIELTDFRKGSWNPPVTKTSAKENTGIEELVNLIQSHYDFLHKHDLMDTKREAVMKRQLFNLLERKLHEKYIDPLIENGLLARKLEKIITGTTDPYSVVEELMST